MGSIVALAWAGLMAAGCSGPEGSGSGGRLSTRRVHDGGRAGPTFTDVTDRAGVGFVHHKPVFEDKVRNIEPWLASVGAAAAAGDYDGDGNVDLYVTNSRLGYTNALYHNNGDGTFTDVAAAAGVADVNESDGLSMDAVWGDYDNDGDEDLYLVKWGRNLLFRNEGNGRFIDVTAEARVGDWGNGNAAIFFDYDGDGWLDLYIGNYFRNVDLWRLPDTRIMHNSFESARDGGTNVLYHNLGDGTFADVSVEAGVADTGWTLDVGAADYDNDGDMDLHVANDFGPDKLYRNEGKGRFTDVSAANLGVDTRKGMNSEFGDFNNDGFLDLYVTNIMTKDYLKEGNMLLRNNGDGSFSDIAPEAGVADGGWGWGAKFLDYDLDGDLDIYTVNGFVSQRRGEEYWFDLATAVTEPDFDSTDARQWPVIGDKSLSGYEKNRFFRNEGRESFVEVAAQIGLANEGDGRGLVVFDYDNDGDPDLYVVNQNQKAALYRNDQDGRGRWIGFSVAGRASGVGTRFTLVTDGGRQIREIDGGNGYASQSDRRVYFGLGPNARVVRVEIRWPDGGTRTLEHPAINTLHALAMP
ncbi:MAG TPA: CRTAC1 family protein [Candidatus Polarisedimenticolia bacterium]